MKLKKLKPILAAAIFMLGMPAFALTENEALIKNTEYKKEKISGEEIWFPRKIQDYIETMLKSDNNESNYQLAKVYYILGKNSIGEKYLDLYYKNGGIPEKTAELYKKIGNNPKYTAVSSEIKQVKSNVSIDNLKKIKNWEIFYSNYKAVSWTEEELREITKIVLSRNEIGNAYYDEIYSELFSKEALLQRYYLNISGIEDMDGFIKYNEKCELYGFLPEPKNELERLIYLKIRGERSEFKNGVNELKKTAAAQNDYEILYYLYLIDNDYSVDPAMIYETAANNEKFLGKLINDVKNGKYNLGYQRDNTIYWLTGEYLLKYPQGKMAAEMYMMRAALVKEWFEKVKVIDEGIVLTGMRELYEYKCRIIYESGYFGDAEAAARVAVINGADTQIVYEIFGLSLEKQGKMEEARNAFIHLYDKNKAIDFFDRNNMEIPEEYARTIIETSFSNSKYERMPKLVKYLKYNDYIRLLSLGKSDYKENAALKYLSEEFMKKGAEENIYFDSQFDKFEKGKANLLNEAQEKNDAEKYYLARMAEKEGKTKEALTFMKDIIARYPHEKLMVGFYLGLTEKISKNDFEIEYKKYSRVTENF